MSPRAFPSGRHSFLCPEEKFCTQWHSKLMDYVLDCASPMFLMADFGLFLRCEVLKKKIFRYKSPQLPFLVCGKRI